MKLILQSIKPQYCELIASGKKTIEVRKTRPKLNVPLKVYIYMTKSNLVGDRKAYKDRMAGKVIGEYVCDEIINLFALSKFWFSDEILSATCLTPDEIRKFTNGADKLYGWHISDLKIYDKPKELSEFYKPCKCLDEYEGEVYCDCLNCEDAGDSDFGIIACDRTITRPPQSWCYVEEG